MAFVITQNCCKDASCVPVCPVDCIRPVAGGELNTTMLFIDPEACIDCGACMEECPVGAVRSEDELSADQMFFKDINAAYFQRHPLEPRDPGYSSSRAGVPPGALRVAIVGAGPAACYAAAELIAIDNVEVNMFERLPTPFGLVRAGVAPDHQGTKSVVRIFDGALGSDRMRCYFNVDVGSAVSPEQLAAHHHAVIYAVGAGEGRSLGVVGEDLPGVHPASDFVGWYNAHPDHAKHAFDLSATRAVIIGNGNVALDVARVLLMGQEALAVTDIADHALTAVSHSAVEEVVVLGRRDIRHGAFSAGELIGLRQMPDVDVIFDVAPDELRPRPSDDVEVTYKLKVVNECTRRPQIPGRKRIVFRFGLTVDEILGEATVGEVSVVPTGSDGPAESISAGLVVTAIGYRSAPIHGLPYDNAEGLIPNTSGRVIDDSGDPLDGTYVTGWVKRGPRGVIGTNRSCAADTVAQLMADFTDGKLSKSVADASALADLVVARGAEPLDWQQWQVIDRAERQRGTEKGRPRIKFVEQADMLKACGQ